MKRARWSRVVASMVLPLAVVACRKAGPKVEAPARTTLQISFKLDPRLAGPTYGGERWVSPPTYSSAAQIGKEATVEAKVQGTDAAGRPVRVSPRWVAADPAMVVVSPVPGHADQVRITVKHPGESHLKVATGDAARELVVRGKALGAEAFQIEVEQP